MGSINLSGPPINVFAFNPNDPLYTEPRSPLPNIRYSEFGQVQSVAYANLRLTALDRLHLIAGLRWSRFDYKLAYDALCTTIPATGTPGPTNCVGRKIGDAYNPFSRRYSGANISWPPSLTLSFDLTKQLNAYVGYTDIYQSQANIIDGDLKSLGPITGSNWEAGLKWQARDSRLNLSVAGFSIRQKGFAKVDGGRDAAALITPDDIAKGISFYWKTTSGSRIPNTAWDNVNQTCCSKSDPNRTLTSKGIDIEATGEILTGWQISASYTYNQTRQNGTLFRYQ